MQACGDEGQPPPVATRALHFLNTTHSAHDFAGQYTKAQSCSCFTVKVTAYNYVKIVDFLGRFTDPIPLGTKRLHSGPNKSVIRLRRLLHPRTS